MLLETPVGDLLGDSACCCVTDPSSKAPVSCESVRIGRTWYAAVGREGDYDTLAGVAGLDLTALAGQDPRWDNTCVRIEPETPFVVLDVESQAADDVKELARSCEEAVYVERSLSGEGVHAVIPRATVAGIIERYPATRGKCVWRSGDGTYELLAERHNVTFTGNAVERAKAGKSAMALLEALAAAQKPEVHPEDVEAIALGDIPGGEAIAEIGSRLMGGWRCDVGRYSFDESKRDAAVCAMAAGTVNRMRLDLDDAERASVTKAVAEEWLESDGSLREKWHEVHSALGQTYGEMTSVNAVAYVASCEEDETWPLWYDAEVCDDDELGTVAAAISLVGWGCSMAVMEDTVLPALCRRNGVEADDEMLSAIRRAVPVDVPDAPPHVLARRVSEAVRRTGLRGRDLSAVSIAIIGCWADGDNDDE